MVIRVYIETTVVSYYTARPSRDIVTAAHQQITRVWWQRRLPYFDAAVSELVLAEAERGDAAAAAARLEAIAHLPILNLDESAAKISTELTRRAHIPKEYINDAFHVAIAAVNGMDYLLTWNCKHLANALIRAYIQSVVESFGYACPIICTPEELMEEPT